MNSSIESKTPNQGRFLVLPENRLAHTALTAWGMSDSEIGSVYLYGPSGIGKSHLVHTAMFLMAEKSPKLTMKRFTASMFAAELTEAIGGGKIRQFQNAYRNTDVSVVEDLQYLERLPESQQQLLSLIDYWNAHGIRMLFTCRKSPGELEGFSARLINRFRSGTCCAMRPLSQESRSLILENSARERGMLLSQEVLEHLSKESAGTPRELAGLILRLEAYGRDSKSKITTTLLKSFLNEDPRELPITLQEIVRATAHYFGVSVPQIRSNRRLQVCVLPRQCAMYLARETTSVHLSKIGEFFSGRDHSTVVRACQRIESLLPEDPELRRHLSQIRRILGVSSPSQTAKIRNRRSSR